MAELAAAEAKRRAAIAKEQPTPATAAGVKSKERKVPVYTDKNWATPAPELTPAEAADLDRSKFDKVYAAGIAVRTAYLGSASKFQLEQLMLAFSIEINKVIAKTKAENL